MPQLDSIFLVSGFSCESLDPEKLSIQDAKNITRINFESPMLIVNAFLETLLKNSPAHIIGISSVAAERARSSNTIYGASKNALESFLTGIRHGCSQKPVKVQIYKMGFLKTKMNLTPDSLIPALAPKIAAKKIIKNLSKKRGDFYLPFFWFGIIFIFKRIPWFIFKKMGRKYS